MYQSTRHINLSVPQSWSRCSLPELRAIASVLKDRGEGHGPLLGAVLGIDYFLKQLIRYQVLTRHVGRLLQTHDVQD